MSSVYWPARCLSQIRWMLRIARAERTDAPAMYKRRRNPCGGVTVLVSCLTLSRCCPGMIALHCPSLPRFAFGPAAVANVDFQTDQHAVRVRKVTDDLADRFRDLPHERRDGQNVV